MQPPAIRYATTDDGARIAFATLGPAPGDGPPLLCMPPFPFSHLEAGWALEGQRRWYERLARHAHVALYDARGTGLSQRGEGGEARFDLEAMTRDLEAVAARLGWERFALCALFNATPVALAYAARHPETVSALVLWGAYARGSDVYPMPLPQPAEGAIDLYWPLLVDTAARMWTSGAGAETDAVAAFFRACVEPAAALRAITDARAYDVDALVEQVRLPTLVLHRPHARGQRADLPRALAARIPDAELVLLEGDAASPFSGDVEAGIAVIERFLGLDTGGRSGSPAAGVALAEALTPRETEILALLARGRANKEIALDLGVSVHTVERHLTNLYAKIGCRSRTEATAFALTHGYA